MEKIASNPVTSVAVMVFSALRKLEVLVPVYFGTRLGASRLGVQRYHYLYACSDDVRESGNRALVILP